MSDFTVNCPNCQKEVKWATENPYKPFCSERCRILDLGEWASGNRYIPSDTENDDATAKDLDKD